MLLALDSATASASIALFELETHQLLAEWSWQTRRYTQDLLATAQLLLGQIEVRSDQITALAVTTGPGSYTGVRVAVSVAKGIGLGLPQLPQVVGIPTLSVTAAPWRALSNRQTPTPLICAYLQAGRGRYNWVLFGEQDALWRPGADDHGDGTAEEFCQALAEHSTAVWLVGELDATLARGVSALDHVVTLDAVSGWRRAGHLARLASAYFAAGVEDGLQGLQPLYLRNLS